MQQSRTISALLVALLFVVGSVVLTSSSVSPTALTIQAAASDGGTNNDEEPADDTTNTKDDSNNNGDSAKEEPDTVEPSGDNNNPPSTVTDQNQHHNKPQPTEPEPATQAPVTATKPAMMIINPCLLDPSDPSCPKPDPTTQDCPPGWAQNEDGNCFPVHDKCPKGYHSHEDDETGRCIPNSTPCQPGYEFNRNHNNCEKEHFTCDGKPSVVECKDGNGNDNNGNHNGDNNNNNRRGGDNQQHDHNKDVIIKNIHNTKIVEKIVSSDDDLNLDQTIVAISYDEGKGLNCVIDNDKNGQCETFDVDKDSGKDPFLAVVQFD